MSERSVATEAGVVQEKFASLSHGKSRYFEGGAGFPTIFLHGAQYLGGSDTWLHLFESFGARLRVLALDSLNWGPGDVLDQEFSFAYLVDHVREFMDVLEIKKANIVGHSMGGWIATLLAYESPNRVNKLVLSDAGGTATRPLQHMVEFQVPDREEIIAQIIQRLSGKVPPELNFEHLLQEHLEPAADPVKVEAFAKVMRHMTNPATRIRYNTLRRLAYITSPTLVTWGSEDKTNDLSLGKQLHEGIKDSKMKVFEGAGHHVPTERPTEWAREVLAFLSPTD